MVPILQWPVGFLTRLRQDLGQLRAVGLDAVPLWRMGILAGLWLAVGARRIWIRRIPQLAAGNSGFCSRQQRSGGLGAGPSARCARERPREFESGRDYASRLWRRVRSPARLRDW